MVERENTGAHSDAARENGMKHKGLCLRDRTFAARSVWLFEHLEEDRNLMVGGACKNYLPDTMVWWLSGRVDPAQEAWLRSIRKAEDAPFVTVFEEAARYAMCI
jgi:hypothetical protein